MHLCESHAWYRSSASCRTLLRCLSCPCIAAPEHCFTTHTRVHLAAPYCLSNGPYVLYCPTLYCLTIHLLLLSCIVVPVPPTTERGSILESWPSALLEAAAAERTGTREQQVGQGQFRQFPPLLPETLHVVLLHRPACRGARSMSAADALRCPARLHCGECPSPCTTHGTSGSASHFIPPHTKRLGVTYIPTHTPHCTPGCWAAAEEGCARVCRAAQPHRVGRFKTFKCVSRLLPLLQA